MSYRPPLHLHLVVHPAFERGLAEAGRLLRWFVGDPDDHAVPDPDIPTFLWTAGTPEAVPPDIPFTGARRSVTALLVDEAWLARRSWRRWAGEQAAAARRADGDHVVVVVAYDPGASRPSSGLPARLQAIRLAGEGGEGGDFEELRLRLTHLVARHLLGGTRTRVFLSHTKAGVREGDHGGRDLARALKRFLDERPVGDAFFDEVSIEAGEDFVERLEDGLEASVVVVLLTERFSGRYWCRWEVLKTKENRRPMLLVDALEEGEPLNLAYAGNVRTIRWSRDRIDDAALHHKVIAGALLELLRVEHHRRRLAELAPEIVEGGRRAEAFGHAPELATLPAPSGEPVLVLHPDPPLAPFEVEAMRRHRPDLHFASLTQALAGTEAGRGPLAGRRIALSISDGEDRRAFGLVKLHQERLWERLATVLLAAGAELAYGGDLRRGGYTERLWDLVRGTLDAGTRLPDDVVHAYLGWPISLQLTDEALARLPHVIRMHRFGRPAGLDVEPGTFIPPTTGDPRERFAWAVSMAEMRAAMARDCDARVLVGGQCRSVGPIPGLVEEFLSFAPERPTYVIGGFGGMAHAIGLALLGGRPEQLTRAFQEEGRAAIFAEYDRQVATGRWPGLVPADFEAIVERLARIGMGGLDNGLDEEENLVLFHSRDVLQITALVLTGLVRCFGGGAGR